MDRLDLDDSGSEDTGSDNTGSDDSGSDMLVSAQHHARYRNQGRGGYEGSTSYIEAALLELLLLADLSESERVVQQLQSG